MNEGLSRANVRRRQIPKLKEHLIGDQTKWIIEHTDYTGMMNEFRFNEKLQPKT